MGKKTYDYRTISFLPKELKIVLPDGYRIDTGYDEDGEEAYQLLGGFSYDEDGEEKAAFSGAFVDIDSKIKDRANLIKEGKIKEEFIPGLMLKQAAEVLFKELEETIGKGTSIILDKKFPASIIMKFHKLFSLFGITMDAYVVYFLVEVSENRLFGIQCVYADNEDENKEFFNHLLNVIKSFRVNGEITDVEGITPHMLEMGLYFDPNDDTEIFDMSPDFTVDITVGDEQHYINMNDDDSLTSKKVNTALANAYPDESLYPHYNSILKAGGLGIPGISAVVNQNGVEYIFYNLENDLSDDASKEMRDAVNKLSDTGASKYKLADRAVEMRSLFHVNPDVFNSQHDRECELAEGMMHKAYMMSALRSFAWTLAKYCDDLEIKPKDLDLNKIHTIIDHIADAEWLNYDDKSFCKGLCGTQDLHVFYLPDRTPESVKDAFRSSQETIDETKRIQESLPNYKPILSQVGSLNKLRKDLEYIHPAIEKIYESLRENRDYSEPLDSNDADILYAWCAVAYAARAPFFSEDGPMNCCFDQLPDNKPKESNESRNFDFPKADVPANRKKYINGDRDSEYVAKLIPFPAIMKKGKLFYDSFYFYCRKHKPNHQKKVEENLSKANRLLELFEANEREEIRYGYLRNTAPIHALKSFVWTAVELKSVRDKSSFPNDLTDETMENLLGFMHERGFVNYDTNLKIKKRFGASILYKQEIKSKAYSYYNPKYSNFGFPDKLDNYVNGASLIDLVKFVSELHELIPAIDNMSVLVNKESLDSNIVETALLTIKAWCMFAFASRQQFLCLQYDLCPYEEKMGDLYNSIDYCPEIKVVDEGRYTIIDGLIMDCNDDRKDVVIPSEAKAFSLAGIDKGIMDYPYEKYFSCAEKITYHKDFKGKVLFSRSVKELIIDSNMDVLHISTIPIQSDREAKLEKIIINGRVKRLGNSSFFNTNNLREVVLPISLEKIADVSLYNNSIEKIVLPEGLKVIKNVTLLNSKIKSIIIPESMEYISDNNFSTSSPELTVKVYKDSYGQTWARAFAEREKGEGNNVRVVEIDPEWKAKADLFIEELSIEYKELERKDDLESIIRSIIDKDIADDKQYKKSKNYISKKARENSFNVLSRTVAECEGLDALKNKLPILLKEDITVCVQDSIKVEIINADSRIKKNETNIETAEKEVIDLKKEIEVKNHEIKEKEFALGDDFVEKKNELASQIRKQNEIIYELEDSSLDIKRSIAERNSELDSAFLLNFKLKKELTASIEELKKNLYEKETLLSKEKLALSRMEKENDKLYVKPVEEMSALKAAAKSLEIQFEAKEKELISLKCSVEKDRKKLLFLKEQLI